MEYEDRLQLATPEGVELELELAGIGSRLCARLIDVGLQSLATLGVLLLFFDSIDDSSLSGALAAIVGVVLGFLVFWAYDALFEAFNAGQTPGKRLNNLRVVGERGEPVSFSMAAVRNLMRLIDEALTLFMGALISILRSPRNQRLGDVAAGTLVVRERPPAEPRPPNSISLQAVPHAASWDTAGLSSYELSTLRLFLERRTQIAPHARAHLAQELARKLRPKVGGASPAIPPEEFLELVEQVKARRG